MSDTQMDELVQLRDCLNAAVKNKNAAFEAITDKPDTQVAYDIALARWSKFKNHYDDKVREYVSK